MTALHLAASNGNLDCMKTLLAAGADMNIQNNVSIIIIHNLSSY